MKATGDRTLGEQIKLLLEKLSRETIKRRSSKVEAASHQACGNTYFQLSACIRPRSTTPGAPANTRSVPRHPQACWRHQPYFSRSPVSLDTVSCSILLCLSSRASCSDCKVCSSETLICKLFWVSCNLIFSWSISISR